MVSDLMYDLWMLINEHIYSQKADNRNNEIK